MILVHGVYLLYQGRSVAIGYVDTSDSKVNTTINVLDIFETDVIFCGA